MPRSAAGTVDEVTMAARTGAINGTDKVSERPPRPQPVAGTLDYPSARFINGEFRAQTFSDEAMLYALAE